MSCKQGVISLIGQIKDTIAIIPAEDYARPLEVYNGSTIGGHFRHIYDFFRCLSDQCDRCDMDYADRHRDPTLESDKMASINAFDRLIEHISAMDESAETVVRADFEVAGDRPVVKSTIGRELMYAYDHAIHHLAIIKIGVRAINPALAINQDLGVAASTIRHRESENS